MFDDVFEDGYIIDKIKEKQAEEERRIQLEIPVYNDFEYPELEKKEEQEPKRVIIIEL